MNKQVKAFIFAIVVALGGFVFGLDAAVISGTVGFVTEQFGLSELQVGILVSSPAFGVLFALLAAGPLCNKIGRKKTLIIIAGMYWISAVTSALAPNYIGLVCARILGGLAFTSITVSAMYIGEIAPPKWRGKLVSVNQMNIVLGLTAAYFVNYLLVKATDTEAAWAVKLNMEQHIWRYMLGSEIVPALVWLVALFFVPESPRWLVYRGRIEEAKLIMHRITSDDEIGEQIAAMEESLHRGDEELSAMSQIKELCHKRMRIAVIVAIIISIAQQLSGINAILFYAPTVFEQLGGGTNTAFQQTVWVGLVSVVFTLAAILLVDKLGRRPMILFGLLWVMVSHLICAYGFKTATYTLSPEAVQELPAEVDSAALVPMVGKTFDSDIAFKDALIEVLGAEPARTHAAAIIAESASMNAGLILGGILSFIAAFHFSIGPLMWVLFSELFPTSLRGVAIPFFALVSSTISAAVQFMFPWQLANMGGTSIFLFYAIVGAAGCAAIWPFLPETKNLSIEEIQLQLEKKTL
ncbi:MFS transporter [Pontiella agarivorans]|uniref:MFS transporter n=1 Tax=Pontiella agarivorans TaxID=3038953 RepID=A0ABU5MUK2_9BACT|nr:MFS transporter [Pontiella agarivorans]MDZ8117812.1 MFS transporter [Pontiella agarivorans]